MPTRCSSSWASCASGPATSTKRVRPRRPAVAVSSPSNRFASTSKGVTTSWRRRRSSGWVWSAADSWARASPRCAPGPGGRSAWPSPTATHRAGGATDRAVTQAGGQGGQAHRGRGEAPRPDGLQHRPGHAGRPSTGDRGRGRGRGGQGGGLRARSTEVVQPTRRDAGLQHLVHPHHEAGHGHQPPPARSSGSTSSTRCRCCRWSSWCPRCSRAPSDQRAGRGLRRRAARQARRSRSQDRAGFIVNALLIPYLLSAIRMLESGFATAEDIDDGMVQGCAHPMGPLALADLIGLDTDRGRGRLDVRGVQGAALHAAAAAGPHGRSRVAGQEQGAASTTTRPEGPGGKGRRRRGPVRGLARRPRPDVRRLEGGSWSGTLATQE